ncbi:MAG: TIGR03936 family radical SAM-associated protein [Clostridiales bacterium]|nr:TIGR03936 family radical SAM-associated protein [Clostridiales bacterium]
MKLIFEFRKTGDLVYISHLDLARLFLRVLRMSRLRPAYSQGFNPHPKLSIVLPLSLGLHSVCELLEFETEMVKTWEEACAAMETVRERLPEGVYVTAWREKPESLRKPLASYVAAASYEFMCDPAPEAPELLKEFFGRDSVIIKKTDKKTGKETEKEIREEMKGYRVIKDIQGRLLAEVTLSAAPGKTLNPVVFFDAFCNVSGLDADALTPVITRTAILGWDGRPLTEI